MIRKLLLLVAAGSLVVALPNPAEAQSVKLRGIAVAAVSGTVTVAGPSTACPAATYSNTGTFSGLQMLGLFLTLTEVPPIPPVPPASFIGRVRAPNNITACIVAFLDVNGNPLISEGDIQNGPFEELEPGVLNRCIDGDIDRGGFITAGTAAAVHFSLDYQVSDCTSGSVLGTATNVPCTGAIVVVPNPLTMVSTIAGLISCWAFEVDA